MVESKSSFNSEQYGIIVTSASLPPTILTLPIPFLPHCTPVQSTRYLENVQIIQHLMYGDPEHMDSGGQ